MARHSTAPLHIAAESHRESLLPNGVLGMLIFILTEIMLFAGLISAFVIWKAGAPTWPPAGQPRLPFEETAVNTLALLASGVLLHVAYRTYRTDRARAERPLMLAVLLGAAFVLFQGMEWVALIREGLTLTSSTLGSFFYLIIGIHALHAVVALGFLLQAWIRLRGGWLAPSQLAAYCVLWYFVVGVWPILYGVVYL